MSKLLEVRAMPIAGRMYILLIVLGKLARFSGVCGKWSDARQITSRSVICFLHLCKADCMNLSYEAKVSNATYQEHAIHKLPDP